jgi:hypothetical protein
LILVYEDFLFRLKNGSIIYCQKNNFILNSSCRKNLLHDQKNLTANSFGIDPQSTAMKLVFCERYFHEYF